VGDAVPAGGVVAKLDTTEIERGYTGQRGQDEQNRRARKAAVQTPGKALTQSTMSLTTGFRPRTGKACFK